MLLSGLIVRAPYIVPVYVYTGPALIITDCAIPVPLHRCSCVYGWPLTPCGIWATSEQV